VIRCGNCEEELPESAFSYQKRYPDRLYKWCDECRKSNVYIPKKKPDPAPVVEEELPEGLSVGEGILWLRSHRANKNKPKKGISHYERTVVKPKFERFHRDRAKQYGGRGSTLADSLTYEQWLQVRDFYQGQCLACGKKGDIRADHARALSQKGANQLWNIQPLCKDCNTRKFTLNVDYRQHYPKFMLEYMVENGIPLNELFNMGEE